MAPTTLLLTPLRNRPEVDAGAVPGAGERFLTTWVMETLPLARLVAGVNVTDCTVRSGRTTLRMTADRNVLLVSSASTTALAGSAMKRSLYRPAGKSGGRKTLLVSEAEVAPAFSTMAVLVGPTGMSAPFGTPAAVTGTRAKPTLNVAATPPWFFT